MSSMFVCLKVSAVCRRRNNWGIALAQSFLLSKDAQKLFNKLSICRMHICIMLIVKARHPIVVEPNVFSFSQ